MDPRLGMVATISLFIVLAITRQPAGQFMSQAPLNDTGYTIIPYHKAKWVFEDAKPKPSTLSEQEIKDIDRLLKQAIEATNPRLQAWYDSVSKEWPAARVENFILILERYKRQYVPVINEAGEKEVFVNCVCLSSSSIKDWKYRMITPRDGGNCYFNVMINLTKGTWYHMMVNGSV